MTTPLLPSTVLDRAADLIEPEGAWTRHRFARDSGGAPVRPRDPRATCWCMTGAIIRAGNGEVMPYAVFAAKHLGWSANTDGPAGIGPTAFVEQWNDRATQPEATAALREAAALARSEGK